MWIPVVTGTIGTLIGIPLYVWLFDELGAPGMALASTLALTAYTLILGAIWHRTVGTGELRPLLATAVRSLAAGGAAAALGWLAVSALTGDVATAGFWRSLAALLVGGLVVTGSFAAVARLLRSPELDGLRGGRRPPA